MKKIAVFTENYKIFYELTDELKRSTRYGTEDRRSGATSLKKQKQLFDYLTPDSCVPNDINIIITTEKEKRILSSRSGEGRRTSTSNFRTDPEHQHQDGHQSAEHVFEEDLGKWTVLTLPEHYDRKDIQLVLKRAMLLREGKKRYMSLIIGIDPGEKPGVAVYGDRALLYSCAVDIPEDCAGVIEKVLQMFPAKGALIRIGHGDSVIRNRIINTLLRFKTTLEIVDETGTTQLSSRDSDIDAAKRIALSGGGFPVRSNMKIEPTAGYLEDIQKKSRKLSRGQFSIDKALAEEVARGTVSLEDAVKMKEENKGEKKETQTKEREENS